MDRKRVCIIGAGPAGIQALKVIFILIIADSIYNKKKSLFVFFYVVLCLVLMLLRSVL